jgi:hypothetical protein
MRLGLAGLLIACAFGLGLLLGHSLRLAPVWTTATNTQDWPHQELRLLASAYDRIQHDLNRQPDGSAATSLLREQTTILRAISAAVNSMSGVIVPEGANTTLLSPPNETREDIAGVLMEAVPTQQQPDLRAGLDTSRVVPAPDLDHLTFDPDLRAPVQQRKPERKRRTDKLDEDKSTSPETRSAPQDRATAPKVAEPPAASAGNE